MDGDGELLVDAAEATEEGDDIDGDDEVNSSTAVSAAGKGVVDGSLPFNGSDDDFDLSSVAAVDAGGRLSLGDGGLAPFPFASSVP